MSARANTDREHPSDPSDAAQGGAGDGEERSGIAATGNAARDRSAARRGRALEVAAPLLMLAGIVVAVTRPPWLAGPLEAAVAGAGVAAPLVFVALCIVAAPLHLNGALVALSTLFWPLPVAFALSYSGSLLGCLLTVALLERAGGLSPAQASAWPGWLRRLAGGVARRPILIGLAARVALGSGLALEAFYLLTGYDRRCYLLVTTVGLAIWAGQALGGVALLRAALGVSPGLALGAAFLPLLLGLVAAAALGRRRAA